jgi:YhcH/YjgK/YiaL family protein
MILDSTNNCTLYSSISPLFQKAFDHLEKTDFNKIPLGKHTIQGEDLFVIVMEYETKMASQCIMENHRKYIDIQYMVSGEENMGVTTFDGQVATTPYDETKEAAFYKPEYASLVNVQRGQFAVFFPHDLHMPCIASGKPVTVRKAVYKVRVQGDISVNI